MKMSYKNTKHATDIQLFEYSRWLQNKQQRQRCGFLSVPRASNLICAHAAPKAARLCCVPYLGGLLQNFECACSRAPETRLRAIAKRDLFGHRSGGAASGRAPTARSWNTTRSPQVVSGGRTRSAVN